MTSLVKGFFAGAVGGLAGSWTMNQFQAFLSWISKKQKEASEKERQPGEMGGEEEMELEQQAGGEDESATLKTAETVATRVFHHELTAEEKKVAEPIVHYGYGTVMGSVYGALAEAVPVVAVGGGMPYAAALWLGGDELAMPLLGLAKSPANYPLSTHVSALAAHCVYGVTMELVRNAVRRFI